MMQPQMDMSFNNGGMMPQMQNLMQDPSSMMQIPVAKYNQIKERLGTR